MNLGGVINISSKRTAEAPCGKRLTVSVNAGDGATLETHLPEGWFDSWHKIAISYDGENVKLFLDGVLAAEAPCVIPEGSFDGTMVVGGSGFSSSKLFLGSLDEVHLVSKAMTEEEIAGEHKEDESAVVWLDFENREEIQREEETYCIWWRLDGCTELR